MGIKEFLKSIQVKEINYINVDRIERLINDKLPDFIRYILSNNNEMISFDDGIRLLSMDEILDAKEDLQIDFLSQGMIPLFDCFDNDFIVYMFNEKKYAKYNIVEEIAFKRRDNLLDYFK